jgi:urocanate hydratase
MNSKSADPAGFAWTVERGFAALIGVVEADGACHADQEPSLGGKLMYAGRLDDAGRAVVVAGSIAGAAVMTATADQNTQKQAVRDGVVDFLVTSLDEALRILKNEIRKRATVAVCIGGSPAVVEREMQARGVLPDLVFAGWPGHLRDVAEFGLGSRRVQLATAEATDEYVCWQVEEAAAKWMPKLDSIALNCVSRNTWAARWLRLAPRYFGRTAQGVRVVRCDLETAKRIAGSIANAVQSGEIGVQVKINAVLKGQDCFPTTLKSAERERLS